MRSMEGTMPVLHFENDPKKINALVDIEMVKATSSEHMFYIIQNNNLSYKIVQPVQN